MADLDDFSANLRAEARKMLEPHLQALEEELQGFGSRFAEASGRIEQYLASIRNLDLRDSAAFLTEAVAQARDETAREVVSENDKAMSFLAHYIHDVRHRETQEEILNLLLDGARMFAPRAVLFVARGNKLMGWSSRGFSEDLTSRIKAWIRPRTASSFLSGALETDSLDSCNEIAGEEELFELLGSEASAPWHAFPLRALGRPVAALLTAATPGEKCRLEALCMLIDATGLCIENLALKILQEMRERAAEESAAAVPETVPAAVSDEPGEDTAEAAAVIEEAEAGPPPQHVPEAPVAEAPEPEVAEGVPAVAADEMPAAATAPEIPEVAAEESPAAEAAATVEPAVEEPEAEVPAIEEPMIPAQGSAGAGGALEEAEAPEPVSAPMPAPEPPFVMPAPMPGAARLPEPEPLRVPPLRPVEQLSEEEKLHAEAKRFARLLVSEIKLYNEERVREGRENRDLYVRLKRDIDRSREMYEKRISSSVTRKVDYFHDELVRILGENTPEKLGSDYPGPRVEN